MLRASFRPLDIGLITRMGPIPNPDPYFCQLSPEFISIQGHQSQSIFWVKTPPRGEMTGLMGLTLADQSLLQFQGQQQTAILGFFHSRSQDNPRN